MSAGARYGWFVLVSIISIAGYFYLTGSEAFSVLKKFHLFDIDPLWEFAVPLILTLVLSVVFGLWWSGNSWRLAALATAIFLGVAAFPIWLTTLIYIGCWGVKRCTNAP
jgi:hypothetical protein